jgi:hypothetical protein
MTRGEGRVSLRRSMQALSGFVIRQRPRVGSRAVIPSPRHQLDATDDAVLWPLQRQDGEMLHPHRGGRPEPSKGHAQASESYGNVILRLFELLRRDASA